MQEIWKDVEGYEKLYQVSNLGRVKSLGNGGSKNSKFSSERILKLKSNKVTGYLYVRLSKDGKQKHYSIHRLVALAFLPNPNNFPQINHKDEDKKNNTLQNLEWCSAEYNNNYGTHNKRMVVSLTNYPSKSKKVLCIETNKVYPSTRQIERELGFANGNISAACNGKRKSAYGYTWRYV